MMTPPSMAPNTVPEPPKMLTPPTTTAATDCSSSPLPACTVMLPKRAEEHETGKAGQRAREQEGGEDDPLRRQADQLAPHPGSSRSHRTGGRN